MRIRRRALKLEKTHINNVLDAANVTVKSVDEDSHLGVVIRVEPDDVHPTLRALRDGELKFEMLVDTFGADLSVYGDEADTETPIEVTYHLRSFVNDCDVRVKTRLPFEGVYHSVIDIFTSVLLPERELCEMYGLYLEDHPNPKRLITNPKFTTPLLKSVPIRGREEVWNH